MQSDQTMSQIYSNTAELNNRITSLANDIVASLAERHKRVTWRCAFNYLEVLNDYSPIESVDFVGSLKVNDERVSTLQRVTVEMLDSARGNMADLIGRYVINHLAQYIMGDE